MAKTKVDNKLNVVIGTKSQIEGDTTIPENSILIVTDENEPTLIVDGDGNSYLSNDGTYKPISGGGEITYGNMTQAQIDTGTSETSMVMSPKLLKDNLNTKVDKVDGKGLSANDYTTADKNLVATITNKANTTDLNNGLSGKVDKITGKQLSTNDYTNTDKTKVNALTSVGDGKSYLSNDGTYKQGVPYLITAPTSANTNGNLITVVLTSEPTTKYDGYLYIITE